MSRLIVKNLPSSVTDSKIKELFSQKGVVTDVQLKYTKDGKFRRFGFVGFKTEEEANAAIEYFDQTCIDTAKISVNLCAGLGDVTKPKAWSKYAPDSNAYKKATQQDDDTKDSKIDTKVEKKSKKNKDKKIKECEEIKEALELHKNDPLFNEFLETHQVSGITKEFSKTEDNTKDKEDSSGEDDDDDDDDDNDEEKNNNEDEKIANSKISDLEYMEALKKKTQPGTGKIKEKVERGEKKFFTVKVRGLGFNHKKKHVKQFFQPLKAKSIRVPQKIKGIAYVGFKTEKIMNQALIKNKCFLEGKRLLVTKYEGENKEDTELKDKNENCRWKAQAEALKDEEDIAESGRMFVRNLSYTTTEEDIKKLFEKYGPLTEVNLPIDKVTRKPKGFGTVMFMMPEHAAKAYSELDGSIVNGRMLHLLPGKAKPSVTDELQKEGLTFKEKKDLEKKATARSSHNWNTLFLGQNAVVDAIASTYNTTKEKILEDGGSGTSVAVRLALGETQLVEETRKFLEENGVKLDAFNQPPTKRSETIILVKNLPPDTKIYEIREMFAKHGELGRVIMPPSGITALVEFLEPSEARKAFSKLAYTKFKHLPLYLEKAPDNSLTPSNRKPSENSKTTDSSSKTFKDTEPAVDDNKSNNKLKSSEKSTKVTQEQNKEEDNDDDVEPDTTLFVKNLNFSTTDEILKEYFGKCGTVHYATVATKKDPSNPGEKLSMGYGFVRYKYKADADNALKNLQMTSLEGKTLELKRSERTLTTDVATTKKSSKIGKQTGTKILVRNIPFQANAKEITELFKAFGELKGVRLPKKMIGVEKHRGFAFVEYYTKDQAKLAFNALCQSTHLYGRRLALEWAQAEEDVEDIRKRTAKHFHQDDGSITKSKKALLDPESIGLSAE